MTLYSAINAAREALDNLTEEICSIAYNTKIEKRAMRVGIKTKCQEVDRIVQSIQPEKPMTEEEIFAIAANGTTDFEEAKGAVRALKSAGVLYVEDK